MNELLPALITFVIAAMAKSKGQVGQGPSAVLVAAPAPWARNTALITHSQSLLHSHLTGGLGLGKYRGGGVNLAPLISAINDGHSQATI